MKKCKYFNKLKKKIIKKNGKLIKIIQITSQYTRNQNQNNHFEAMQKEIHPEVKIISSNNHTKPKRFKIIKKKSRTENNHLIAYIIKHYTHFLVKTENEKKEMIQ